MRTTINDLGASPQKVDPAVNVDNDADDKSYLTSNALIVEGDHDTGDVDPINNNADV